MKINTVAVLGANGTMGCNVAGIFASFGNAKVYLIARDKQDAQCAVNSAVKSVRADSIHRNLIPMDYSCLKECIFESDLVFESVSESLDAKKSVLEKIALHLRHDTLVCTGTSGLSINELADSLPETLRKNFYGVHMYNPPYSMRLCEFIPSEYADEKTSVELRHYLREVLNRAVVEVKDTPAFLGNRIGFYFINKLLQYADEFKCSGGIDYIDAIFGPFTGRAMAPLRTADFVGLDVHKAIVDNVRTNGGMGDSAAFIFPAFAEKLVEEEKFGRKSGTGLYWTQKFDDGTKHQHVFDIEGGSYRKVMQYRFPFAGEMNACIREGRYEKAMGVLASNQSHEARFCLQMLLEYVAYSLYMASEIGEGAAAADDVMATGFNWCPPVAMVEAFGGADEFLNLAKERLSSETYMSLNVEETIAAVGKSAYDYRRFMRAGR